MNIHTLWFHPQIKELLKLLRDIYATKLRFRAIICNGKTSRRTNRTHICFAYVIVFLLSPWRPVVYNYYVPFWATVYIIKYYIPERLIVRNVTLRNIIINRGEAEVDNDIPKGDN